LKEQSYRTNALTNSQKLRTGTAHVEYQTPATKHDRNYRASGQMLRGPSD